MKQMIYELLDKRTQTRQGLFGCVRDALAHPGTANAHLYEKPRPVVMNAVFVLTEDDYDVIRVRAVHESFEEAEKVAKSNGYDIEVHELCS